MKRWWEKFSCDSFEGFSGCLNAVMGREEGGSRKKRERKKENGDKTKDEREEQANS